MMTACKHGREGKESMRHVGLPLTAIGLLVMVGFQHMEITQLRENQESLRKTISDLAQAQRAMIEIQSPPLTK
jgi:hypothetical protein